MFDSKSENRDRAVEAVESVPEVRVRVRVRFRKMCLVDLRDRFRGRVIARVRDRV